MLYLGLIAVLSVTAIGQNSECGDGRFEHKSPVQIASMTGDEKMEQMVLEQMFHVPVFDENFNLLHDALVRDIKILPKAIEYATGYDSAESKCRSRSEARLLTAAIYAGGLDDARIRIRSTENGKIFIRQLEAAIKRRKAIKDDARNRVLENALIGMTGLSIKDDLIGASLAKRYNIRLSRTALSNFSNYLLSTDPEYPSWTHIAGWAEMPPDEAKRYYEAYRNFKKSKKPS